MLRRQTGRLTLASTIFTLGLSAQNEAPVHVLAGVVVDASGKPVPRVWIDHTGKYRMSHSTDVVGRFQLTTGSPAVVFRKPGFRSVHYRAPFSKQMRIVLHPAEPTASCKEKTKPHVEIFKTRDNDYTSSRLSVVTKTGKAFVVCGEGPNWSSGVPSDRLVWQSIEYQESVIGEEDGFGYVHAKGITNNGKHWRYIGGFGSSCDYRDAHEADVAILDCVIENPK